ncbi:c-type cytochrome [Sphingobium boeckii]|uniref:Cytochrome c n=1 Tax=Sphingobium boeckii TaxID=1082345 RepID=A0A7W9EFY2_9SPHN|nr:c-type cytochrome [Sphingobium boeckii]MBB5687752.1 cytochrome c [Sphingobium boeckii]
MRTLLPLIPLVAMIAPAQAQSTAPPAFGQCATCHAIKAGGAKKLGPELSNLAGKPAAAKPGFVYSKALKAAKIVWTDAKLDAYLAQPSKTVPGTSMVYGGMRDPKARAAIIAYLKSLR